MANVFAENRTLTYVDLSNDRIGQSLSLSRVFSILAMTHSVFSLSLVDDVAAAAFAQSLQKNRTLRQLLLRHNNIRNCGQLLAECVQSLPQLMQLDLTFNDVNFKYLKMIEDAVKVNARNYKNSEPERLLQRIDVLRV